MSTVKKSTTPKTYSKKARAAPTHPSWAEMIKVSHRIPVSCFLRVVGYISSAGNAARGCAKRDLREKPISCASHLLLLFADRQAYPMLIIYDRVASLPIPMMLVWGFLVRRSRSERVSLPLREYVSHMVPQIRRNPV